MSAHEPTPTADRDTLARQADDARERLGATLAALDQKRHAVTDELTHPADVVRGELRQHAAPLAAIAAGALVVLGSSAVIGAVRARRRARQSSNARWNAVVRAWRHPERMATSRRPSLASLLGRRLLAAVVTVTASELVRYAMRRNTAALPR